jgi:hypothetical protein
MLLAHETFSAAVDTPRLEEIAETGFIVADRVALWRSMDIVLHDRWPLLG